MPVTQETLRSYTISTDAALDQWEAEQSKATQHEICFARLLIEANEIIIGLLELYNAARGNITLVTRYGMALQKIAQYDPEYKGQHVNDMPGREKLIRIAFDAITGG